MSPLSSAAFAASAVVLVGLAGRPTRGRRPRRRPLARGRDHAGLLRRLRPAAPGEPIDLLRMRSVVEGGGSILHALDRVAGEGGPWADAAARARRRVEAGLPVQEALDAWAHEAADPAVRGAADALALAGASGGSQAKALEAAVEAERRRRALRREVRALAAQARTSAAVLVVLPLGFAVAVAVLDRRVAAFFVHGVGPAVVAGGVALDLVGAWWMARLVRAVS